MTQWREPEQEFFLAPDDAGSDPALFDETDLAQVMLYQAQASFVNRGNAYLDGIGVDADDGLAAPTVASPRDRSAPTDAAGSGPKGRDQPLPPASTDGPDPASAHRANQAFADFTPSRYSPAERARPNYLAPGDDLIGAMTTLITKGVEDMKASQDQRSLRLNLSEGLLSRINPGPLGPSSFPATIDIGTLIDYLTTKLSAGLAGSTDPVITQCEAELEAERRMLEIQHSGATLPGTEETSWLNDDPTAQTHANASERATSPDHLVKEQVNLQMATATSPESQLLFAVPKRADQTRMTRTIQTFELRDGPSDVTSYHDFSSLQIAFEHVWTEVFDRQLQSLGKALYHEYVRLKPFLTGDAHDDRTISTLEDLTRLMDEIRELSRMAPLDAQIQPGPVTRTAGTSGGTSLLQEGAKTLWAADPLKDVPIPARIIFDPGGALISAVLNVFSGNDQLTWRSFPGPLRQGDLINVSIKEGAMPPGTVEIVLRNTPDTSWWKGIEFKEFGADRNVVTDRLITTEDVSSMRLQPSQLTNGVLEFQKAAIAGFHTGFYLLGGLDEKLKDRSRVTFTWVRD